MIIEIQAFFIEFQGFLIKKSQKWGKMTHFWLFGGVRDFFIPYPKRTIFNKNKKPNEIIIPRIM